LSLKEDTVDYSQKALSTEHNCCVDASVRSR